MGAKRTGEEKGKGRKREGRKKGGKYSNFTDSRDL
jgi:hypothetical protein